MHVIKAAEAPRFELPGVEFSAMAAPSRGSANVCTWRLTVAPHHVGDAAHVLDRDEIFMVLSGVLEVSGQRLGAGDVAIVPAGAPIAVGNPGDEPAVAHVAIAAGFQATMADGSKLSPPWAR
ncbi:cupin domain-containing protein [Nocardia amikacinitolerans]|uniref:cupin domain-containing protein n=1 Tax=Nocardia amikacinitolerans TaxID=756689 RepID=UPI0020A26AB7|nr:cupin domain-containing protein [Nocardia amikacinitolerans]MCP2290417.1 Cupin domain-containing protein [Nocardia amikacinitolerans]